MSRSLLHRTKLAALITWLDEQRIEHRPGVGDYQVMQIRTEKYSWQAVYDRAYTTNGQRQHLTVTAPLEGTIRKFIRSEHEKNRS